MAEANWTNINLHMMACLSKFGKDIFSLRNDVYI